MSEKLEETWHNFILGNHDAFNDLYKDHYLGLINYGSKWTEDKSLVNDYIIEMFLDLWEKKENLPEVRNVRSYLLTCLRTIILQKLRVEKLHDSKVSYINSFNDQHESSYEEQIIKSQIDTQLKKRLTFYMEQLTHRQRELLKYRFFDNMTYDEIAETCDITKRTAYNIVHDALKILKESLKKDENGKMVTLLPCIFYALALYYTT